MEQKSFMLTRPFEFKTKDNGDLLIKGDISSTDKDLVNDICTLDCLKSMKSQIESRNMKLDIEHEAFRGSSTEEKEINKTKIPAGRMYNPTIRQKSNGHALEVEAVINQHMDRFKEIKGSIEGKFLDAFSIAFIPTRQKTVVKDGEQIRMLDDVALLNVALTGNPVNTAATMRDIVSKSIDSLEEYKTAKLTNPEVEDKLEVKSELKETGSDKEKRKLRKEAISEGEEEDDEETKKTGKKYEKKAYEKDGAHAHTEAEPLGLHNHSEIEEQIRNIWDFILKTEEEVKSHSNEINIITKEDKKQMTEKETKNEEVETVEESKEEVVEKPAAPKEDVLSEVKAMIEAQNAKIDSLKSMIESKDEEVEVKEVKSNPKAMVSNENAQSLGKEVKSVAGLSLLK